MMKPNKRILILCEDKKSSLLYFKSFKNDEEFKRHLQAADVDVFHPKNFSPLGLVNDAIKRQREATVEKNPYNDIWVVFDKDKHTNIHSAYTKAQKNKEKFKINIAISIICFEYWILLHFNRSTRAFNTCDELISFIKMNYFPKYNKCTNCFEELRDKIDTAIKNGKWVEKQVKNDINRGTKAYNLGAYTDVHKLVEKLIK